MNSIKRRLLRKYIKTKEPISKEDYHKQYKTLRNKIKKLIKVSKKMHYQSFFAENAKNIRNTWSGIKNLINSKNSNKNFPNTMFIDSKFETDPKKIAEGFNTYFSSIAEKLQDKIHQISNNEFSKYLKEPVPHNFLFSSVSAEEIVLIINSQ